jgi:hypothetical protein
MITVKTDIKKITKGEVFKTVEQWKVYKVYFLFIPVYINKKLLSRENK